MKIIIENKNGDELCTLTVNCEKNCDTLVCNDNCEIADAIDGDTTRVQLIDDPFNDSKIFVRDAVTNNLEVMSTDDYEYSKSGLEKINDLLFNEDSINEITDRVNDDESWWNELDESCRYYISKKLNLKDEDYNN